MLEGKLDTSEGFLRILKREGVGVWVFQKNHKIISQMGRIIGRIFLSSETSWPELNKFVEEDIGIEEKCIFLREIFEIAGGRIWGRGVSVEFGRRCLPKVIGAMGRFILSVKMEVENLRSKKAVCERNGCVELPRTLIGMEASLETLKILLTLCKFEDLKMYFHEILLIQLYSFQIYHCLNGYSQKLQDIILTILEILKTLYELYQPQILSICTPSSSPLLPHLPLTSLPTPLLPHTYSICILQQLFPLFSELDVGSFQSLEILDTSLELLTHIVADHEIVLKEILPVMIPLIPSLMKFYILPKNLEGVQTLCSDQTEKYRKNLWKFLRILGIQNWREVGGGELGLDFVRVGGGGDGGVVEGCWEVVGGEEWVGDKIRAIQCLARFCEKDEDLLRLGMHLMEIIEMLASVDEIDLEVFTTLSKTFLQIIKKQNLSIETPSLTPLLNTYIQKFRKTIYFLSKLSLTKDKDFSLCLELRNICIEIMKKCSDSLFTEEYCFVMFSLFFEYCVESLNDENTNTNSSKKGFMNFQSEVEELEEDYDTLFKVLHICLETHFNLQKKTLEKSLQYLKKLLAKRNSEIFLGNYKIIEKFMEIVHFFMEKYCFMLANVGHGAREGEGGEGGEGGQREILGEFLERTVGILGLCLEFRQSEVNFGKESVSEMEEEIAEFDGDFVFDGDSHLIDEELQNQQKNEFSTNQNSPEHHHEELSTILKLTPTLPTICASTLLLLLKTLSLPHFTSYPHPQSFPCLQKLTTYISTPELHPLIPWLPTHPQLH